MKVSRWVRVELPPHVDRQLQGIKDRRGLNDEEAINRAIAAYAVIDSAKWAGNEVLIRDRATGEVSAPPDCPGTLAEHPITRECRIVCLKRQLSAHAYNPLERAYSLEEFDKPKSVGNVVDLYESGKIRDIDNLGRRKIGEIGLVLQLAGLIKPSER